MSLYLYLSSIIFVIGTCGIFLLRKHIIIILFAFELLILASVINFVSASIFLDDLLGQVYALLILTVAPQKVH